MNKKGFTLVELLATLVVLAIIVGIVLISATGSLGKTKEKTEDVFVKTLKDALEIYIDSDGRNLDFSTQRCTFNKKIPGTDEYREVKLYYANKDKNGNRLTFNNVINSNYHPISASDMYNPANKDNDKYQCDIDAWIYIYRDEDYVYYYYVNNSIDRHGIECLNKTDYITNLPCDALKKIIGEDRLSSECK